MTRGRALVRRSRALPSHVARTLSCPPAPIEFQASTPPIAGAYLVSQAPLRSPRISISFSTPPQLLFSSPFLSLYSRRPSQPSTVRLHHDFSFALQPSDPGGSGAQFEFEHCSGSGAQLRSFGCALHCSKKSTASPRCSALTTRFPPDPHHGGPDPSPVLPSRAGWRPELARGQSRLGLWLYWGQQA